MLPHVTPVYSAFTLALELNTTASHSSSTFRTDPIQNTGDHFPSRCQPAESHNWHGSPQSRPCIRDSTLSRTGRRKGHRKRTQKPLQTVQICSFPRLIDSTRSDVSLGFTTVEMLTAVNAITSPILTSSSHPSQNHDIAATRFEAGGRTSGKQRAFCFVVKRSHMQNTDGCPHVDQCLEVSDFEKVSREMEELVSRRLPYFHGVAYRFLGNTADA